MLQKGWDSIKQAFVSIAKASLLLGYTPDPWRNSLGIFLPKPGKDNYYNPKYGSTKVDGKGNSVAYGSRSQNISFDAIERALDSKCKSAEVNQRIRYMIHNRQTTV